MTGTGGSASVTRCGSESSPDDAVDAVVLAGGYATRLWPITRHRPKMFLPVGDATVVDRTLAELESDDRVADVHVSTNERFADDFRDYLEASRFEKPSVAVEGTSDEGEKRGVIAALADLIDREGIDRDLLVVAGDNLIDFPLGEFVDHFRDRGGATLAAHDVGARERASEYGVVELAGGRVVGFEEKPAEPASSLVSIACYGLPAETLHRIEEYLAAGNDPDEPGWLIQWLHDREPVWAYTFEEAWFDIGTPESYLDAVAWAMEGGAAVDDAATVEDSSVGTDVQVVGDACIRDTRLERCVVLPGADVVDCDLTASIVGEETRLDALDLHGALIGGHSRVTNGEEER